MKKSCYNRLRALSGDTRTPYDKGVFMVFLINNPLGYVVVLAVILLSTKLCGLAFRKMHLPEVLGFIIAGIIIGPAVLGQFGGFTLIGFEDAARAGTYKALFALEGTTGSNETISVFSKVGVILIMFSAGLETNIDDIRHTGLASFLIATAGVAMPFALGFVISLPFGGIGLGTENIFRCVFIGTILTATSVAITVSVLKELGKINTKLGTTIVSAAVMDDVMVCFVYSWVAEAIFGVADITGAFLAGIILATVRRSGEYVDSKINVNSYTIFAPVFFANIGISNIDFSDVSGTILLFAFLAVLVGLIGKVIGCGAVTKAFGYNLRESVIGGVGMMARGEVALIVTQKVIDKNGGMGSHALGGEFMIMTVLLILASSILTPILLKVIYGRNKTVAAAPAQSGNVVPSEEGAAENALSAEVQPSADEGVQNIQKQQ